MSAAASSRSTSAISPSRSPRRPAVSAAWERAAAIRCSSSARSPSRRRHSFWAAAVRSRRAASRLRTSACRAWAASVAARPAATAVPVSARRRWPSSRSASARESACSISARRSAAAARSCSAWRALRVQDRGLAVQARGLLLGGLDLVPHRDEVLLRGVDRDLERAGLGRGRARDAGRLRHGRAQREEPSLDLLLPRRDLLHLAPGSEEALDVAAALDHRAAQRLAREGHAPTPAPAARPRRSASSSVATTIASGSEARMRSAWAPPTR